MAEPSARATVRDLAAILAAAVAVALAFTLAPRLAPGGEAFNPAAPPEELQLCRTYGRSAVHASPLPNAPVVEPGSAAFNSITGSTIGEPACPFVFEVRLAPDRYVQYTGGAP